MRQFVSRKDAKIRKDAKENLSLRLCVSFAPLRETNSHQYKTTI